MKHSPSGANLKSFSFWLACLLSLIFVLIAANGFNPHAVVNAAAQFEPSSSPTPIGYQTPEPTFTPFPTNIVPAVGTSYFLSQYSRSSSLALDQNGIPYVSYYAETLTDLKVARCNSATACDAPTIMTLATQDQSGFDNTIALDANGIPVVAYGYNSGGSMYSTLKLAYCNNNTTCDTPTIRTIGPDYGYFSLAIASDGRPVIAYLVSNSTSQQYAWDLVFCDDIYCNTYVKKEIAQFSHSYNGPIKLALTNEDIPIVAYSFFGDHTQVGLALCDNQTCDSPIFKTVESPDNSYLLGDLALDSEDNPIVFYSDYTYLKLLHCNNHTTCDTPTYSRVGNNRTPVSLDLDSNDVPYFSFVQDSALMLGSCETAVSCAIPGQLALANDGVIDNKYIGLEISQDRPIISYYNSTSRSLLLYMGSAINWVTPTPTPTITPTATNTPTPTNTPITPTSPPDASPPRDFFAVPTAILTWNAISWAQGYVIQIDDDPNFGTPFMVEIASTDLGYTTPELGNGLYYWRIQAKNGTTPGNNWGTIHSFVISAPATASPE